MIRKRYEKEEQSPGMMVSLTIMIAVGILKSRVLAGKNEKETTRSPAH